ncbi:leukocyte surface antigen CD53-like [Brevipalpus obovatus]|uniref:leukocyte surface antigen CD53-like n=1 Tax=Brevipalpus obovatus TaxID=246614 RepID=UPI003D9DDE7E
MGFFRALNRHCVGLLSFATWLLGSVCIAFTLWTLITSNNKSHFFNGNLPIIYVALLFGGLFFTNGLLGWMGSFGKNGGCMLKMSLFLSVLLIASEIGGIISLSILRAKVDEIVEEGWNEMNVKTRNAIQTQLSCCGLTGPSEFAHSNEETDISCYQTFSKYSPQNGSTEPQFHETGCKDKMVNWIHQNRIIWISSFGGLLLFQVMTILLTVSAINNLKSRSSSMESLDEPHTMTYM